MIAEHEARVWLANIRAEAEAPGALVVVVGGRVAIFPEDIVARSDDELPAYIARRLKESNER